MKKLFTAFRIMVLGALVIHFVSCEEKLPLDELVTSNQEEEKEEAIKRITLEQLCPNTNHVHAVDLGLSVKWACCNIDANSPEYFGGYYAWGETEVKYDYSWYTYKYCKGRYFTMTKYCTNPIYASDTIDNRTTLEPSDDVAYVKWGNDWRMPTKEEMKELIEQCEWEWVYVNGFRGQRVIGPNGNSIFLPAAGCYDYMEIFFSEAQGHYWSSTLQHGKDENLSYSLNFKGSHKEWSVGSNRSYGHSIRAVKD